MSGRSPSRNPSHRRGGFALDEQRILEAIAALGGQIGGLEARFDGLETRFDGLETRFVGLETRFEEKTEELHWHFDVVAESLRGDLQLVAEGVTSLSERHDRFEVEVRREFVATRALLEPPTRAIGRRVTHLEEDVDDLRGRVGRLEAGR